MGSLLFERSPGEVQVPITVTHSLTAKPEILDEKASTSKNSSSVRGTVSSTGEL